MRIVTHVTSRSTLLATLLIACLAAFTFAPVRADDVRIGISSGATSRLPVRCVPLTPGNDRDSRATSVQADEVLASDLQHSAVFDVARAWDPNSNVTAPQAEIGGRWVVSGASIKLEGQVRELPGRKSVLVQEYKGPRSEWRRLVHAFADDIVKQFTGESGVANTRIAFVAQKGRERELWTMDFDGENARALTNDRALVMSPGWSPDGSLLIFTSYRAGGPQLWVVPAEGGKPALLSGRSGINTSGRYAPDGQRVACTLSQDGNSEIYVLDARGGSPQRLTNSRGIDTAPAWSPTGREIAFTSDRSGKPQVYIMDAAGADPHRLTYDVDYTDSPDYSPKGDRIAFVTRTDSGFDIVVARTDGTDVRRLVSGGNNENPHWSPDGRHLVFASDRDGQKGLWISDLDGAPPRKLDTAGRIALSPAWSPRPATIAH